MLNKLIKSVVILSVCSIFAVSAEATTMATFTGTVLAGTNDGGQSVTGFITYNIPSMQSQWTDGSTFNIRYDDYYPSPGSPLMVTGAATDGTTSLTIGGGGDFDAANAYVYKNAPSGSNHYDEAMLIAGTYFGGQWTEIQLDVYAFTDGIHPSGIFGDTSYANPNLSVDQRVNWFAPGSTAEGFLNKQGQSIEFSLNSVVISQVPEPATLGMFVLALCGIAFTRRARSRQ